MAVVQCYFRKRRRIKKYNFKVIVTFISILITLFLIFLDHQLRPVIKIVAEDQAHLISTRVLNQTVIDELLNQNIEYSDIVKIEKDVSGKVLAINTDTKKVNILKSTISNEVQKRIAAINVDKVKIPIGTLSGREIFSGRGPCVNLKIMLSGNIETDIQSKFSSAGINQTRHQIYMSVRTKVQAMIPGYPVTTGIDTSVLVAETVIVGEVGNTHWLIHGGG